ncbi:hypothetical protein [Streptomyces sulphureus]|uniref:hypothetical protein n=1 Tax=Streptomyces sulphureus TaxID=47758 RepID=UPI00037080C2|nr:hypothetical protein [Streptomyces sulphureus]
MPTTDHSPQPASDDEPQPAAGSRQSGRRRGLVATAAAAVLLAGGGGYWAAAANNSSEPPQGASGSQEQTGADVGPGAGAGKGSEAGADRKPEKGKPWRAVDSYRVDGRTLTVTFTGGVCEKYRAQAKETDERVTVAVKPEKQDSKKVCIKMAKKRSVKVALEGGLGEREVIDARSGNPLPRSAAG